MPPGHPAAARPRVTAQLGRAITTKEQHVLLIYDLHAATGDASSNLRLLWGRESI